MLDACREPRLVEEHRDELGIARELWMQPLDRAGAREADRPEEPPEVHRRHAASGDLAIQRVAPKQALLALHRNRLGHVCRNVTRFPAAGPRGSVLVSRLGPPDDSLSAMRATLVPWLVIALAAGCGDSPEVSDGFFAGGTG